MFKNKLNNKIFKSLLIILPTLILSSCFKSEVQIGPPPSYETITVTDSNMSSNLGTGSIGGVGNTLFTFELQNNKFVIDKDMDNFSDKYSVLLKSKKLDDVSYVGFRFFSIKSLSMDYQKDIQRELQTKINYTKKPVDLGNCIVNGEGSEKGKGWVYIKKCEDLDYLVQLINEPYEDKSGKKEVGYKAYTLDKEIKSFIVNEYFDFNNTDSNWNASSQVFTKKTTMTYDYESNSQSQVINGLFTIKEGKTIKNKFFTKRNVVIKGDTGIITDIFIEKTDNYDMNYEILKNIKIVGDIKITEIPGKFADFEIFDGIDAKYNSFLLFRKPLVKPKNVIEFIPRFPNTMYVKTFIGKSNEEVKIAEDNFIKNFSFKPGYEGKTIGGNIDTYVYTGENTKYVLLIGKNVKGFKEYQGKYIYAEIDKEFLQNNVKTYMDFLGKIK